jgi:hypothetical protein
MPQKGIVVYSWGEPVFDDGLLEGRMTVRHVLGGPEPLGSGMNRQV